MPCRVESSRRAFPFACSAVLPILFLREIPEASMIPLGLIVISNLPFEQIIVSVGRKPVGSVAICCMVCAVGSLILIEIVTITRLLLALQYVDFKLGAVWTPAESGSSNS